MKIAVAVDGSENGLRAAKQAIFLASHLPVTILEVIFVADFNKAKDDYLLSQSTESLLLKREKKVQPVMALASAAGVTARAILLKGNPSREIINYVAAEKIDHLLIGSRGLNTFQEMMLGSVSHKVMKHATCPVTIVK